MIDPLAVLVVAIGPFVGSFLSAEAQRICAGRSTTRRSVCDVCGAPIRATHLVPILSWLALRGRGGCCGRAIPRQALLAEILGLGAGLAAAGLAQSALQAVLLAGYLWVCLGLALIDARCFRLPDLLTGALAILGLTLAWEAPGVGLLTGAIGALFATTFLFGIRVVYGAFRGREGLGLGDVKLGAGLGAAMGVEGVCFACLLAACGALLRALLHGGVAAQRFSRVAFGAWLSGAGALVLCVSLAMPLT